MRLLADEHVPPAVLSALRGEGHDIAVVGDALELGVPDTTLLDFARETDRAIVSEDIDFRGADPELAIESHRAFWPATLLLHPARSQLRSGALTS